MRYRVAMALVPVAMVLSAVQLHSLSFESLDLNAGYLFTFNGYQKDSAGAPIAGSQVDPILLYGGVGVTIELAAPLKFAPAIDLFALEYLLTESGKVVPTQQETSTSLGPIASVPTLIVSLPVVLDFELGDFTFGFGLSPSFVLRIPFPIAGTTDAGELTDYFYADGRFFYPEAQLFFGYRFTELVEISVFSRLLVPIYNLWDRFPDIPFHDELIITTAAQLSIHL